MTLYGEPSPALAELIEKLAGVAFFRRFSLLQGLNVDIEARDEVPHRAGTSPEGVVPVNQAISHKRRCPRRRRPVRRLLPALGMDRGRITQVVIGAVLVLISLALLGAGGRRSGPTAPSATTAT
jgi:hypothetical protein